MSIEASRRGRAAAPGWPSVRFTLLLAALTGYPLDLLINGGGPWYLWRSLALGAAGLAAFAVLDRWPRRLPAGLARWALQVLGVALAMPATTSVIWMLSAGRRIPQFWTDQDQLLNFAFFTLLSLLIAPWAALIALVRHKDAIARQQALAFELERSELERQALEARLRLLQAQVSPHFLFNTLANVQALVDSGSPQASAVLRSLITYLRAATPRLHEPTTTLGQELQLVEAYLEVMSMRIPDRLQFALDIEDQARLARCPSLAVLTLVENAVRHGVDPSEAGGRIDVEARIAEGRCQVRVRDTGLGLRPSAGRTGTGLAALREQMDLIFPNAAGVRLTEQAPCGTCAELDFPAQFEPA